MCLLGDFSSVFFERRRFYLARSGFVFWRWSISSWYILAVAQSAGLWEKLLFKKTNSSSWICSFLSIRYYNFLRNCDETVRSMDSAVISLCPEELYCFHGFALRWEELSFFWRKFLAFLSWQDSGSKLLTVNGMKNLRVNKTVKIGFVTCQHHFGL